MTGDFRLSAESRPALPRFVKLKYDKARGLWVLLAPERILVPDETSVAVLQLCDGRRTLGDIVADLAARYDAPATQIGADVTTMLADLAAKGFLTDRPEAVT